MSESGRSRTKHSAASSPSSSKDEGVQRTDRFQPGSVYLHTPFCLRRCAYCDFATAPLEDSSPAPYLAALEREMERIVTPYSPQTIYFGGGTPTALPVSELTGVLTALRRRITDLPPEWTCEANPESVTQEKAELLRDFGVNRVSLGAQSFDPAVLRALGRDHAPEHTITALEVLRRAGFDNLSLDLIYAAPGQGEEQLRRDLAELVSLGVPHLSAYCLTYEAGTPLTSLWEQGKVRRASEERELSMFRLVRDTLRQHGFEHYEISNFARPGHRSRHNQVYWRRGRYFGFGLGAGSFEGDVRRTNTRIMSEYLGPWPEPRRPPHDHEVLSPEAAAREQVVLGIRLAEGVDLEALRRDTGWTLEALYSEPPLETLETQGLAVRTRESLRLTDRGFELADLVAAQLV